MTRYCRVVLAGVVMLLVADPPAAYADNCGSLADCYGSVQSASGAAAGMALVIGLMVLIAPTLLQGTNQPPPPAPPPPAPPSPAPEPSPAPAPPPAATPAAAPAQLAPPPLPPLIPPMRPRDDKDKRDEDSPSGADVPGVADRPVRYDEKALANIATRGWSRDTVEQTARSPHSLHRTRDTRFNVDGSRDDQPATAFIRADGWYVVLNDRLHDVVQVSAGPLAGWPPTQSATPDSFAARVAAGTRIPTVLAGTEPCYPIAEMNRVLDYCEAHSIRVLGMEGFIGNPGQLVPRPDMILDCSAERNAAERPATIEQCIRRARELVAAWSRQPDCFVSITVV